MAVRRPLLGAINERGADRGKLTGLRRQTSVSDMTTTTTAREFVRDFARLRKIAANGGEIVVRDRSGRSYVFRATDDAGPSLAEQLSDLRGTMATGVRVKRLDGFGRNRP
jgi:hypothetical protein